METNLEAANAKIAELEAELSSAEAELILTIEAIVGRVEQSTDQIGGRSAALVARFLERKEPAYAERAGQIKGNAAALAADIRNFIEVELDSL